MFYSSARTSTPLPYCHSTNCSRRQKKTKKKPQKWRRSSFTSHSPYRCDIERVLSHEYMSHVTNVTASCITQMCHAGGRVMSNVWMSHVTYERVISHIWMRHVTHLNESCRIYEWVQSHIWMSHVTHMGESRHARDCVESQVWMSHVTRVNLSCHTCGKTSCATHVN